MSREDRSWMSLHRCSEAYNNGVIDFLDKAFAKGAQGNEICCPCKKCFFRFWYQRDAVYEHLIVNGFVAGYKEWIHHGEDFSNEINFNDGDEEPDSNAHDDMDGLLHDTFRDVFNDYDNVENVREGSNAADVVKVFKLVEEGKQELYPGCKNFSKLSFTIRLYLWKCLHGISNTGFGDLLVLLKEAFPEAHVPHSFNEAKKVVKELGLDYKKIHACPNDCMLFWKEYQDATNCHVCGASRWKSKNDNEMNVKNHSSRSISSTRVPAKVLRHFPLKPRLQRLYMCSEVADSMTWHSKERRTDGNLRHPADAKAWKDFDSLHTDFAQDPRNVRLALASDGFNPFRNMNVAYSIWPVILINYNLPLWLATKPNYLMLSLLIPGPSSPGNDIDVYMQPLIEELKELWEVGVETYDASIDQSFQLRACLLWTISDFPAYAMLSGWSTKGKLACPRCNHGTCSQYLTHSKKTCYLGARVFLKEDHPYRLDKKSFDGKVERGIASTALSGTEILNELSSFVNVFGKTQKRKRANNNCPWKKRSIFFDLPYWEYNSIHHTLDVMHIEKNVCDSVLGTLLEIPFKNKDHYKARLDLRDMGIRKELQPFVSEDGKKMFIKQACFAMNGDEKETFCRVVQNAKFPHGCASNMSRKVNMKEKKISGYKTHDAHFFMHYLLPVAVRRTLSKRVAAPLMRLSAFFKGICSKSIKPEDLPLLQTEIVEILCQLEMIFPPTFFDVMVHLPIHLTDQIGLCGPVHGSWMYPLERDLGVLKSHVRNRSRPEGSIAEGYLAQECLNFCSMYLHSGVKTKFTRYAKYYETENGAEDVTCLFPKLGYPIGGKKKKGKTFNMDTVTMKQAHRYALFNCGDEEVEKYISEHQTLMDSLRGSKWAKAQNHSKDFVSWFEKKVMTDDATHDHITWIAKGPNPVATKYGGYVINGYRFHTRSRDARCNTQNSGVTLNAMTSSFASSKDQNPVIGDVTYYGAIEGIIEIDYWGQFSCVLFECVWFQVEKDDYGLTRVNSNKLCYLDDPFVMASQVQQVFYVEDPLEVGCHYVMKRIPGDIFDSLKNDGNIIEPHDFEFGAFGSIVNEDLIWSREELDDIEMPLNDSNARGVAQHSGSDADERDLP